MNPKHLHAERIPKLEKAHNSPSCDKLNKPNYISQLKNAPADWKCNKQCYEDHLSVLFREIKFWSISNWLTSWGVKYRSPRLVMGTPFDTSRVPCWVSALSFCRYANKDRIRYHIVQQVHTLKLGNIGSMPACASTWKKMVYLTCTITGAFSCSKSYLSC